MKRKNRILCPECQIPLSIIKTCLTEKKIRLRRRVCPACKFGYWSMQYPEISIPDERIKYNQKWSVTLLDYIP